MRTAGKVLFIVLLIILAFMFLPMFIHSLAKSIAHANGCQLSEGIAIPCVIGGGDWGGVLHSMYAMGWLVLGTLPLGGIALAVWAVFAVIYLIARVNQSGAPRS